MKIRPLRAELFQSDRRTNMTKPNFAFRNFVKALNDRRKATLARR